MKAVKGQSSLFESAEKQYTMQETIPMICDLVKFFTGCKGYAVDGMEVEDLVQECFVHFLEKKFLERFIPGKCTYKTYVSYGVRNLIIDLMRRRNRGEVSFNVPLFCGPGRASDSPYQGNVFDVLGVLECDRLTNPEHFVLALDFFNRVKFALPAECETKRKVSLRALFVEYFEKLLSCVEIARKYGESVAWVQNRLAYIKEVAMYIY